MHQEYAAVIKAKTMFLKCGIEVVAEDGSA
jgi:hypothetical protein